MQLSNRFTLQHVKTLLSGKAFFTLKHCFELLKILVFKRWVRLKFRQTNNVGLMSYFWDHFWFLGATFPQEL